MPYDSTISFTLDTICPWTFIGLLRLRKAVSQYQSEHPDGVKFNLKYFPYQLYPNFSTEGEDKYEWYLKTKYDGDKERMEKYTQVMGELGRAEGVEFKFGGTIANTLNPHRLIQWVQETKGPEAASKAVDSLYAQYFTQEAHPSSHSTLLKAATAAGVDEQEAKKFIEDEEERKMETKKEIREQADNEVDSVPYVMVEGRRRDFTLIGAKSVEEYMKCLKQVEKESK